MEFVPFGPEHRTVMVAWFADPELQQRLGGLLPLLDTAPPLPIGHQAWMICEDNQWIGFVLLERDLEGRAWLAICVDPKKRNHGLGRRILTALAQRARRQSIVMLMANVERDNHAALRCGHAAGFRPDPHRLDEPTFLHLVLPLETSANDAKESDTFEPQPWRTAAL